MKSAGWWMTAPAQGASSCQLRSMLRFPRSTEGTGWRRIRPRPAKGIKRLYEAMEGFGGLVRQIRETVRTSNADSVNYRPLEILLQPAPWHRGHVVLIGDAAHATTPHLASGAGMAIEDGIVLAEEIAAQPHLELALER